MKSNTEILKSIVSGILSNPERLSIESAAPAGAASSVLIIHVSAADYPKVIGQGGSTFKAIELVIGLIGRARNQKLRIVLPPPKEGAGGHKAFAPDHSWSKTKDIKALVAEMLSEIDPALKASEINSVDADITTVFDIKIPNVTLPVNVPLSTLQEALSKIVQAIGKTHGRNIFLDISVA